MYINLLLYINTLIFIAYVIGKEVTKVVYEKPLGKFKLCNLLAFDFLNWN